MARNQIQVESLPSDLKGCKLDGVDTYPGKVSHLNEHGVIEKVDGLCVEAKMDVRVYELRDPRCGRIIELYDGTKFRLTLQDIQGQICPSMMCLGEITVAKGKEYTLTYCDDPIEGWTIRDRSVRDNPNAKQLCYPEGIKTQRQLMDLILEHEAIHACSFADWSLEYPPEIQSRMDMEQLEMREKSLAEKQSSAKKEFERQQALLKAEREKLSAKKKESEGN